MYVKRYGEGEKIYFGLHGWSGDHRTFAPLAANMPRASASLYSADLPGCGQSPALSSLTLDSVTDEIVKAVLIAAPPGKQITLIGNCSGAILALLAVERIEERVRRLVLIDPFAYWPWYFRVFVTKSFGSFGRYAYRTTFANPFGRWLTNQSLRAHRTAETDLTNSFGNIDHDVAQRYLALLAEVGGIERFAGLRRVPVEIVYGERTFGAVKQSIAMWQQIWPQARARVLAGAGHLPILEATTALSEIVFANDGDEQNFAATTEAAATGAAAQARESEARA